MLNPVAAIDQKKTFEMACQSTAHVLITGPTGSGKTLLARRIHDQGTRANKPFVAINLATLSEGTFESELFGHERGAFTGAEMKRVGRLELANGGTIFLDEVGELSPRQQARLLEFLQTKTLVPVGGNRESKLNVRVIAATHRNLRKLVKEGKFREDLFHRLRILELRLKPMKEMHENFGEIVHKVLEDCCSDLGKRVLKIDEPAVVLLERHPWPGNIRELRHVLEYAVLSTCDETIRADDLPEWFVAECLDLSMAQPGDGDPALGYAEVPMALNYHEALEHFEKLYLKKALARFRGRINHTARKIGVSKATLIRRVRIYGLNQRPVELPVSAAI